MAAEALVRVGETNIAVLGAFDHSGIVATLGMAMERYGERITIHGSGDFRAVVIRVAVDAQLRLRRSGAGNRRQAKAIKAQRQAQVPGTLAPTPARGA